MSFGNIAVALRSGRSVDPRFLLCWTRLILNGLRDGDEVLTPAVEMPSHYAAQCLARTFLDGKCDSILFLDDDMIFTNRDLATIRDDERADDYSIMSGLCCSRNPPHKPLMFKEIDDPIKGGPKWIAGGNPKPNAIEDTGITGLAFTLIKREVFESMAEVLEDGEYFFQWSSKGDSEDATFCMRARELGFKIGINTRAIIGHRFPAMVVWDDTLSESVFKSHGTDMTK